MKTTIYELLGMIKDGKAPKEIKYEGVEYYLYDDTAYLRTDKSRFLDTIRFDMLNDEVEILETTNKPDKIEKIVLQDLINNNDDMTHVILANKINEIIDKLNNLK